MKTRILLIVILGLIGLSGKGQTTQLWGMTSSGGAYGGGTIFHINLDGTGFALVHSFDTSQTGTGFYPGGDLFQASNGKLYGMTQAGGANSSGVLFSFDATTNTYSDLYDFNYATCTNNSVIQIGNGKLFGLCEMAGAGFIFSFDIATNTYTDLYDFDGVHGANPTGSLVFATNGMFYGTTLEGGSDQVGTLFSFDSTSNAYADLMDFDGQPPVYGWYPGSLIQATNGYLYGTCDIGPMWNTLILYKFDIGSNTGNFLNGINDMLYPSGHPLQASNGKLYGMTSQGGTDSVGGLYRFDIITNGITEIFDFNHLNGANPQGSLVEANNSKLYSMTSNGGLDSSGVLFSYDIITNVYTDLLDFNGTNGANPLGSLILLINITSNDIKQLNFCKDQISISPNPFTTQTTLTLQGTYHNPSLFIYNLLGQEVTQTFKVSKTLKVLTITIDRGNLPSGMYFYKLIEDTGGQNFVPI